MSADARLTKIARECEQDVFIGMPILYGKTVWGVLVIYGDQTLLENPEEIKMLEIIARQIGIAIENRYLREQSEQLSIIEERNRIARELHDSVTQSLYSLTLFSETAKRMMDAGDQGEARRYLEEIADSSQQALKEMRLLVYKLRPSTPLETGLAASIDQRLRAVEGRSGIKYDLRVDKGLSFDPNLEKAIYAIVVETLNNSIKHARADQVWVRLDRIGASIYVEIGDNGIGFDFEQAKQTGGLGLVSIQERAAEFHGEVQIDSAHGTGTTICVRFPE
jgi:signal transduction histidine kinase